MWKGEWKAWVAWWVGWPLTALVFSAVAVCVVTSRHHGPAWTSGNLNAVRVLDADFKVVRVVTGRAELDAFAACFHRADEVAPSSSGRAWTHKLDIDGPGGGRWLYDAASGEFTVLSMNRAPMYRLKPADKARVEEMLAAGTQRTRPGDGERPSP
jgi:hypothetical protein